MSNAHTIPSPPLDDLTIQRPGFAFIQTCMGRKDHVQQSSKVLLEDSRIDGLNNHYILVDYFCPENTGDWVEEIYGDRATVVRASEKIPSPSDPDSTVVFNKPQAQNWGALAAIRELDMNYLVFFDSDTLVTPELLTFIFDNASSDRFMIFAPDLAKRDLTGFLVVHQRPFQKVNGYDLSFLGWGAEDLDLRLRLYLNGMAPLGSPRAVLKDPDRYAMQWDEIPIELASSIPHQDDLRVQHYAEKDKDLSHEQNLDLLCKSIFSQLGKHPINLHPTALGPSMRRLLGVSSTNPKDF